MEGLEPQQVGRRACGGGGAFALPENCRRIVVGAMDGALSDVRKLSEQVVVRD